MPNVELKSIVVRKQDRRRRDLGDIDALMASITAYGLIDPLVVQRNDMTLVHGYRRYTAVSRLEWASVPVVFVEDMTAEQRFELEKELDERHKPLTEYEKNRQWVEKAVKEGQKLAAKVKEEEENEGSGFRATDDPKPETGGRPSKYGVDDADVANALGIGERTLRRAESHVRAVEELGVPAQLPQQTAIAIAALPADRRSEVINLVNSQTDRDPKHLAAVARGALAHATTRGIDLNRKGVSFIPHSPNEVLSNIVSSWRKTATVTWDYSPEAIAAADPKLVYEALNAISHVVPILRHAESALKSCWKVVGGGVVRIDSTTE